MDKQSKLDILRHSTAHILAAAVLDMFPEAKFAIGPTIEDGFYYDFDLPRTLIPEDLPLLEEKMREIIKQNSPFERSEISVKKAQELFKKAKQPYKVELIKDLVKNEKAKNVSVYRTGSFVDLCRGPHIDSAGEIKFDAFKLLKIAGAYWRGSEKNKMLQRIYGTAWESNADLETYLRKLEEAEKRDHRKLGQRLGLFFFDETAPGMPYWLPKGLHIINSLIDFWQKEHQKRGYVEISTPLLNKKQLYETSGHWEHYRKEMFLFQTEEKETYALKPMNCPNAMIVYKHEPRSYKELPLRLGDTDILHRNELSGTLSGLFRVRALRQDDAHIFITEEQIKSEHENIFEIADLFYSLFDIDYYFRLSTRPDEFMGDKKLWEKAEKALEDILKASGKKYIIGEKEGAFYGPKIDILMKDSLGREWQTGTIQLDFQLPLRFNLTYTDQNGKDKTPVVIHRVIYGSLERFIGILIEHTAGAFPVWLAPEQVWILPIGSRHEEYAVKVAEALKTQNIRITVKNENETIGKKIREGEMQKIPYLLIVGDKEVAADSVAVRERGKGDLGPMKLDEFEKKVIDEIKNKK
ncbi:MAG: threonine--tRNA ligase [bacterium]